jgi:prepilin-type processing-associated H-X9-DG protein
VVISTLLCPSDGSGRGPGAPAPSSYAACHHDVEAPIAADNHGVFFLNSAIRYEDIGDGSSQTIFLGEKRLTGGPVLGWASGTRDTLRNTGSPVNNTRFIGPIYLGGDEDADDPGVGGPGAGGGIGKPMASGASLVGGFSSFHSGGVNVGFGDGSVRFLKDTTGARILQHLGHRDDGEMISAGDY